MYRGMSGPLASVAAINAIGFGVYGNVSRRLQNPDVVQSAAIAGCASGFVQVTQLNAPKILCIDLYDLFYQIWEIEFAFFSFLFSTRFCGSLEALGGFQVERGQVINLRFLGMLSQHSRLNGVNV